MNGANKEQAESFDDEFETGVEVDFFDPNLSPEAESLECLQKFSKCSKYKGHLTMIPFEDFSLQHLPPEWRDEGIFQSIIKLGRQVVRIRVGYTSPNRPDRFPTAKGGKYSCTKYRGLKLGALGTGWADFSEAVVKGQLQDCPLKSCSLAKPHQVTPFFKVTTARHVVYDDEEAKHTVLEFFYDSSSRDGVVEAEVVGLVSSKTDDDHCILRCISHDLELFRKAANLPPPSTSPTRPPKSPSKADLDNGFSPSSPPSHRKPLVAVVAHPHGHFKHVSLGEWLGFKPVEQDPRVWTAKVIDTLVHTKKRFPRWKEEGWEVDGAQASPERIMDWERAVEKNPDVTWAQWMTEKNWDPDPPAFITYSAATCPGSSGGEVRVFLDGGGGNWVEAMHASHFRHYRGGRNGSGMVHLRPECKDVVTKCLHGLKVEK